MIEKDLLQPAGPNRVRGANPLHPFDAESRLRGFLDLVHPYGLFGGQVKRPAMPAGKVDQADNRLRHPVHRHEVAGFIAGEGHAEGQTPRRRDSGSRIRQNAGRRTRILANAATTLRDPVRQLQEWVEAVVRAGVSRAAVAHDDRGTVEGRVNAPGHANRPLRLKFAALVVVVKALAALQLVLENRVGTVAADEGRGDVMELGQPDGMAQFQ